MVRSAVSTEIQGSPVQRWRLVPAGLISLAALLVGMLLLARPHELDTPVRDATRLQAPEGGAAQFILKGFALASGTRALFLVGTIVGVLFAVTWRDWRPGVALVTAVVGASLSADVLKSTFDRPSPEEWAAGGQLGTAFPSAHTAVAVAAWGLIVILAWRRLPPAVAAIVAALAGCMLAGALASRVLLGDHWASDVLAGAGLGGLWLCAAAEICLVRSGSAAGAGERA
jgi:undecaprenyl-diphosphatase